MSANGATAEERCKNEGIRGERGATATYIQNMNAPIWRRNKTAHMPKHTHTHTWYWVLPACVRVRSQLPDDDLRHHALKINWYIACNISCPQGKHVIYFTLQHAIYVLSYKFDIRLISLIYGQRCNLCQHVDFSTCNSCNIMSDMLFSRWMWWTDFIFRNPWAQMLRL